MFWCLASDIWRLIFGVWRLVIGWVDCLLSVSVPVYMACMCPYIRIHNKQKAKKERDKNLRENKTNKQTKKELNQNQNQNESALNREGWELANQLIRFQNSRFQFPSSRFLLLDTGTDT